MLSGWAPLLVLCVVSFSGQYNIDNCLQLIEPQNHLFHVPSFEQVLHRYFHSLMSFAIVISSYLSVWSYVYYGSEIRPELMDCNLGEESHQVDSSYPLFITGNATRKEFDFRFTFDPPLILVPRPPQSGEVWGRGNVHPRRVTHLHQRWVGLCLWIAYALHAYVKLTATVSACNYHGEVTNSGCVMQPSDCPGRTESASPGEF